MPGAALAPVRFTMCRTRCNSNSSNGVSEPGAVATGSNIQVEFMIGSLPLPVLTQRCARTVELTRRRESNHPSPREASCERRSRRSRPTICSAARQLSFGFIVCPRHDVLPQWMVARNVPPQHHDETSTMACSKETKYIPVHPR